jgi:hypothetical protein
MRLLISFFVLAALLPAQQFGYAVLGRDAGAWPEILASVGLLPTPVPSASVLIARSGTPATPGVAARVEAGAFLILEGDSPLARSFGFHVQNRTVKLASFTDIHQPETPIILQQPVELTEPALPAGTEVFTRERWLKTPAVAGFRKGKGGVLWVITNPGTHGYERFPFIANALCDLGFVPPFQDNRLWAFFDYAYRARVDVEWFAKRWHKAGIAALHVAAWHFYEEDPERDRYLKALIAACHREGVLVYAWLELPHVSERFWAEHPEWREKTALLQDAQLDWRKLMNLADPDCAAAVSSGVEKLTARFDWDGLNFAELYYESLEGAANPARFTPMNKTVRAQFQAEPGGFDPFELWSTRKDAASLRKFLDYRAGMARALQKQWLSRAESYRAFRPDLDIVLTHVDDRLDTGMRDAIGADTSGLLPLLDAQRFTFLVEDPATVWNQGPQRYPLIASRYPKSSQIAIDINIVERYQDVYPTKQQTGLELFDLVHLASASFGRVALYIENALNRSDLTLLSAAASGFTKADGVGRGLVLVSNRGGGVRWAGGALVDGAAWPVKDEGTVWLPAGSHSIEHTETEHAFRLFSLTGELLAASYVGDGIRAEFTNESRSIARFNLPIARALLDGKPIHLEAGPGLTLLLPKGRHTVLAWPQADDSGPGSGRDPRQTILSDRRSQ